MAQESSSASVLSASLVKEADVIPKDALRLDVIVEKGHNLKPTMWQKMVSLYTHNCVDGYVRLSITRPVPSYDKFFEELNQVTSTKKADTNGNVSWNERFSFVVPTGDDGAGRGDLVLGVMDHHTILGDFHCSNDLVVSIDKLKIDETRAFEEMNLPVQSQSSISISCCLRKLSLETIDMRLGKDLYCRETETIEKRKAMCAQAIGHLLGQPMSSSTAPVVSIVASGGGFRAMTGIAGSVLGLRDVGVLDCCTHFASLSGSTWYLSNLYTPDLYNSESPDIDKCADYLKDCCSKMGPELFIGHLDQYLKQLHERRENGQSISLVDLWGCYLATVFGVAKQGDDDARKVSHQRKYVETAKLPFPLYTVVHVQSKVATDKFSEWMEFTPYEYGIDLYGSFMEVENLAGNACKGVVCRQRAELDQGYLMGLWGSAFGVTLHKVLKDLEGTRAWKKLAELFAAVLHLQKDEELRPFAASPPNMLRGIARRNLWKWLHTIKEAFNEAYDYIEADIGYLKQKLFNDPPVTKHEDVVLEEEPAMILVDAGAAFNDPFPPILRPERRADVLIVFDDGLRKNQWTDPFEDLDAAAKWAEERGYKMPTIDHKKFNKNEIVECYVFEDEEDEECPIVVFFPLCNPDLKKEPGKDEPVPEQAEVNPFAKCYSTFNLNKYDEKQFDGLKDLCRSNATKGFAKIKQAIAKKAKNKQSK
eukprot:m.39069 g.39069  ORF g.39069 m.39069 type:complete len:704 (+) comp32664_c0_seq3:176-2287(+)